MMCLVAHSWGRMLGFRPYLIFFPFFITFWNLFLIYPMWLEWLDVRYTRWSQTVYNLE